MRLELFAISLVDPFRFRLCRPAAGTHCHPVSGHATPRAPGRPRRGLGRGIFCRRCPIPCPRGAEDQPSRVPRPGRSGPASSFTIVNLRCDRAHLRGERSRTLGNPRRLLQCPRRPGSGPHLERSVVEHADDHRHAEPCCLGPLVELLNELAKIDPERLQRVPTGGRSPGRPVPVTVLQAVLP